VLLASATQPSYWSPRWRPWRTAALANHGERGSQRSRASVPVVRGGDGRWHRQSRMPRIGGLVSNSPMAVDLGGYGAYRQVRNAASSSPASRHGLKPRAPGRTSTSTTAALCFQGGPALSAVPPARQCPRHQPGPPALLRPPRPPRHHWQKPDTEPASEDHVRFSFAGKKSIEYEAFSYGIMKRVHASRRPEPA
jgi:hypothetical protein